MAKRQRHGIDPKDMVGSLLNKTGSQGVSDPYSLYQQAEVPGGDTSSNTSQKLAYQKARLVARTNYWLKGFLEIKNSILNYKLQLRAGSKNGKPPTPKDVQNLEKWLDKPAPLPKFTVDKNDRVIGIPSEVTKTYRELVTKFIEDCWYEYLLLDNLVTFWTKEGIQPITLAPEKCRYRDILGIETLFFTHGLGAAERKILPKDQALRFSQFSEIAIDSSQGESFKVLKNERVGNGLAWPSIQPCFRTLDTMQSMEMGESTYAFGGRMHMRHHKLGHAIVGGPMGGMPKHFWTKKKADTVQSIFEDKSGFLGDYTSNFDYVLEYPHEDTAYFDEDKWNSPEHRLIRWGGPLAQILLVEGVTPFSSQILKSHCLAIREKMRIFLNSILSLSFGCPVPIDLHWSDMIFNDCQLAAQLLQFGVTAGAVSYSTFREEAGFDDEREAIKKDAEGKDAATNPEKYKPPFDPAHGDPTPAPGSTSQGGAPRGRKQQG